MQNYMAQKWTKVILAFNRTLCLFLAFAFLSSPLYANANEHVKNHVTVATNANCVTALSSRDA
jgi:hypothetical protein